VLKHKPVEQLAPIIKLSNIIKCT